MNEIDLSSTHDGRDLRTALGRFPTGVTVITTTVPDGRSEGLTANSFSALSLSPPLVLWSIVNTSGSLPGFMASGHFAINVLDSKQSELSSRFAARSADKFTGLDLLKGVGGSPVLASALAVFECSTERTLDIGDHVLFIGRVHRVRWREGDPLVFNAGQYCTARPMGPATELSMFLSGQAHLRAWGHHGALP